MLIILKYEREVEVKNSCNDMCPYQAQTILGTVADLEATLILLLLPQLLLSDTRSIYFFNDFWFEYPFRTYPFAASWFGTTSSGDPDEDSAYVMRLRRNPDDDQLRPADLEHHSVSRPSDRKCEHNPMRLMGILVVCLMVVSVVFSVSVVLRDPPSNGVRATEETKFLQLNPNKGT